MGGGTHNYFLLFEEDGTYFATFNQNGGSGWGLRDLTCDGTYMYGSLSTAIDYYDIGTRIKVGSFTGPQNPNRALAWDGTHFYTGNFGREVYRLTWNGVSGSTATSTVWSTAATSVYGAAWDEINDCMWVTSSDASGIVAEINEDGTLVQNHILVSGGIYGGACMGTSTGCIGTLWILVQTPSDILGGYEVYPTALGRDTWGAIKAVFQTPRFSRTDGRPGSCCSSDDSNKDTMTVIEAGDVDTGSLWAYR